MLGVNLSISTIFILIGSLQLADGFSVFLPSATKLSAPSNGLGLRRTSLSRITALCAKRKMSMAEKRKRRQSKQRQSVDLDIPASKLDFKSAKSVEIDGEAPIRVKDPTEAASQAQEMLKAQRASVDMLTLVRERVENLNVGEISNSLETSGYAVVDGFLNDKSISDRLCEEGTKMYNDEYMETDMKNLGSGEYVVSIEGGEKQYSLCPRLVELVVSTTKHVPEAVKQIMTLDASACMATLRIFDHTAFKASLALLTGESDESVVEQAPRSFSQVAEDADDKRRLSLHYFVLPITWDETMGGGLEFETGSAAAKRDRLVIWKSDRTMFRKQPWKGKDQCDLGGCIELHLVEGAKEE